jgi:hypothetical protein
MITRSFKTGFGGFIYLADCYKARLIGFDDVVLKALAKEAEHHESIDGVFYINVLELYGNKQVPEETFSSPEHQAWLKERGLQSPVDPQPISDPNQLCHVHLRPTIEELDKILNSEDDRPVKINDDGSITVL